MATPQIPTRPARSQDQPAPSANMEIPQSQARSRRSVDLSTSFDRASYARSPLNDPSFLHQKPPTHGHTSLSRTVSRDQPARPPSVDFPSVGGEGNEYAHFSHGERRESETKTVSPDLPLHAPKASLPPLSARAKVGMVVRTDSNQAAAAGIGKPSSEAGDASFGHGLSRTTSAQASRPASIYGKDDEPEHGIPRIGFHIPLFPGAGDVQAPSPAPSAHSLNAHSLAGPNASGKNHSRTRSGREVFHGPPGSYGMHGHGHKPTDPLEKAWYSRHPDEVAREAKGEKGTAILDRKEYTMSSEQLNRLVHDNKSQESMGASSRVISTPSEQIGYLASQEYAIRMSTPKGRRPSSQHHADSPLRKAESIHGDSNNALESDAEYDDNVIHIDPPTRRMKGLESVGLNPASEVRDATGVQQDGAAEEFDIPILAADEAAYRPEAQYMQPAVDTPEPQIGRRGSRPGSRQGSIQLPRGPFITREDSSTPLDNVKEYEPLFPEEDDDEQTKAAKLHLLKKKRPDLARHHFPSSDVWEDTPSSLMYETTVDVEQEKAVADHAHRAAEHEPSEFFETPEAEAKRKTTLTKEDQQNFLPEATKKLAKTRLNPDVMADMPTRPGLRHRFPSQDVWEDTPDSAMYTTVVNPQEPEQEGYADDDDETTQAPNVPARPAAKQAPIVPDRPKPQVPARPTKSSSQDEAPLELTKTSSSTSDREAPAVKPKPNVPARPVGSKIAQLQAGFMNDLNQRLKLGPQAPPSRKEEPMSNTEDDEEEKAPLADARKGRAKGPARRKPAAAAAAPEQKAPPAVRFSMMNCWTVWEIDEDEIVVPKPVVPAQSKTDTDDKPTSSAADDAVPSKEQPADIALMSSHASSSDKAIDGHSAAAASDASVQTGAHTISTNDGKDLTAYVGGQAHPAGDLLVEGRGEQQTEHVEGHEHVSGHEGQDA